MKLYSGRPQRSPRCRFPPPKCSSQFDNESNLRALPHPNSIVFVEIRSVIRADPSFIRSRPFTEINRLGQVPLFRRARQPGCCRSHREKSGQTHSQRDSSIGSSGRSFGRSRFRNRPRRIQGFFGPSIVCNRVLPGSNRQDKPVPARAIEFLAPTCTTCPALRYLLRHTRWAPQVAQRLACRGASARR